MHEERRNEDLLEQKILEIFTGEVYTLCIPLGFNNLDTQLVYLPIYLLHIF